MRHVKTACGLAVAVCAFCVTAVPAMANGTDFVASINGKTISPTEPAKTKGRTEEAQVFKFGTAFTIKCQQSAFPENRSFGSTAQTKGEVTEGTSKELEVSIKFMKCGRYANASTEEFTPASIKGSLTIKYHINGYGELEGNGEGEENEYGKEPHVELLETAATINVAPAKQCKIIIPAQTIPVGAIKKPEQEFSSAVYSNEFIEGKNKKFFPDGEKERLVIANEFKKMKYRFAEETQCGVDQPKEQGTEGSYRGTINLEIGNGNIGIAEEG